MHSFPEKYIISACALFGSILPTTEYESGKSGKGLSTDYKYEDDTMTARGQISRRQSL